MRGGTALQIVVAREELARQGVGHAAGIFGPDEGMLRGAAEPLRSTHLNPMLDGLKRGSLGITEPKGMPRPTYATIDGDHFVVTGKKSYITGGQEADFVVALVEVEGQGPAMIAIDLDSPGVSVERRFESIDGSRHAAFSFTNVRVPLANRVGRAGEGRSQALQRISAVRRAVSADCVGTMIHLIDLVAADLKRPRRGGPLAKSERARLRFGEMRVLAYAARSMLYRTAVLADAGEDAVNETIATKVFCTEAAGKVADMAMQMVGGDATVVGHPVEKAARAVRVLRLAEGETDTLRVNLARGFLDLNKGRL
ncbi:acyl-CoA dehydrogenase, partial [Hyaloraphidium curvatum]